MSETIRGQVSNVRLIREGWGILEVLYGSANEIASVTGHPLGVDVGDTVEIVGTWTTHRSFGKQFRSKEIRVVAPSDASGAIEWMVSRLPQVGRKLATAIVAAFGVEGTWHVLEHKPSELVYVTGRSGKGFAGITPERADAIHAAYVAHLGERDRMVELKKWGLTDRQIARITTKWGERALEELRRDPYQLAELVDGFGFKRADDVAMRMGLPPDHPSRVRAVILHLIGEASGHGHVYVPKGALVRMACEKINAPAELVRREANALLGAEKIVMRGGARVYGPRLVVAEDAVTEGARRLLGLEERGEAA